MSKSGNCCVHVVNENSVEFMRKCHIYLLIPCDLFYDFQIERMLSSLDIYLCTTVFQCLQNILVNKNWTYWNYIWIGNAYFFFQMILKFKISHIHKNVCGLSVKELHCRSLFFCCNSTVIKKSCTCNIGTRISQRTIIFRFENGIWFSEDK